MKNQIIRTLVAVATIAAGVGAYAQDVTFKPTLKNVSMYGGAYKQDEIALTESPDGFKFVFGGDPVADNNQKAIQVYCEVYNLQPGKYDLKFRIKGQAPATEVVAHLMAQPRGEAAPKVKIGEFKRFGLTGEWKDAVLPVEIKEPVLHGWFIMRVGSVPKGGEIDFAPEFTFTKTE